jgi:hypothetical protein
MDALKVILILAVVVTVIVLAVRADRKRKRLLRTWARTRGFTMFEHSQQDWEKAYPAFKLLDQGRNRHSALHLEGEAGGRPVRCLDYRYTTGSGKNRRTHRYSIVVVSTGTPVIPLRIRPEHMFDKVGEFFGLDDIDFESSEFSRRYHVSSSDRKWAFDVINPRTMEYLLTISGTTIEFGFAEVAVYASGSLTGERCQRGLKIATRMLELVPEDVLAQLRGD